MEDITPLSFPFVASIIFFSIYVAVDFPFVPPNAIKEISFQGLSKNRFANIPIESLTSFTTIVIIGCSQPISRIFSHVK